MSRIVTSVRLSVALPLAVSIMAFMPASAHAARNSDDPAAIHSSTISTDPAAPTSTAPNTGDDSRQPEPETSDTSNAPETPEMSQSSNGEDSLKNRATKMLNEKRQSGKQRSVEQRQKACQKRQTGIDKRLDNLGSRAQRHLDTFDALFTKVQAYQATNTAPLSNYGSLVADVTAKQVAATSAVSTLNSLAGTKIDCTSTDPASTLASAKVAAGDAKTSLQAYRSSLKNLVKALADVNESTTDATDTTAGGTR